MDTVHVLQQRVISQKLEHYHDNDHNLTPPPLSILITIQTKNLCHEEKEEKRLGRIEAAFRKFDLDGDGYLRWVQILDMIVFHLNFIPIQRKIVFEMYIS